MLDKREGNLESGEGKGLVARGMTTVVVEHILHLWPVPSLFSSSRIVSSRTLRSFFNSSNNCSCAVCSSSCRIMWTFDASSLFWVSSSSFWI